MKRGCALGCVLVAGAVAYAVPNVAGACGGTFCDAGPQAMPVEQTGETVLFVLDGDRLQTHIQIRYDPQTEAERFAWVIPVMALPEFSIGSQPLFDALLSSSAVSYGFGTRNEPCTVNEPDPCEGSGLGGEKFDVGSGPDSGGPEVVQHQMVGAFEIAVLDGGTAQGVFDWLQAEGFALDEAATPILQEYLDDGFMFVALELAAGAEADEVHPIVLQMPVTEPCVPIKLTRIASKDDLQLRTLFLGDGRVVPDNYAHIIPNDLQLDWLGLGQNYDSWVTLAVDEAGGQGFVTEYAGPLPTFDEANLYDEQWNAAVFREADWIAATYMYAEQFLRCSDPSDCSPHPLAVGLQQRYLPIPTSVSGEAFFGCPECFTSVFDEAAWDPLAFADALQERLIDPGLRAQELVRSWPWLTRMYTTISPHEMTLDPTFAVNLDAPAVADLSHIGQLDNYCDGTQTFELPDGPAVAIDGASWPDIGGDAMPALVRVERYGPAGAPVIELDQSELISMLLQAHNDAHGPMRPPDQMCGGGDTDTPGLSDESGGEGRSDDIRGCVCTTGATTPAHVVWPLLVLLGGLRRRRRV